MRFHDSLHHSFGRGRLIANPVFLAFETEQLNPCQKKSTSTVKINVSIGSIGYVHFLVPRTRNSLLSVEVTERETYEAWIAKPITLHDIITTASIATGYQGWHLMNTNDATGILAKLEGYLRNCKVNNPRSPHEILQLPTVDYREACAITHLLRSSMSENCSSGPSCVPGYYGEEEEGFRISKQGNIRIILGSSIRTKAARFVPMKFQTPTLSMKIISCGQTIVSALQYSALFDVFDIHIWILALISAIICIGWQLSLFNRNTDLLEI